MTEDIYILGIESSCDETAASVVKNGREVLSNVISSQIDLHTLYGGVVPEIASRKHIEKINQVVRTRQANATAHNRCESHNHRHFLVHFTPCLSPLHRGYI